MTVTHPTVPPTSVRVREAGPTGVLAAAHPLDYVHRRRFPAEARARRGRS